MAYHEGFKNGANTCDDYAYDLNGNLTSDANKEIVSITYNHLNLPELINFGANKIQYFYSAAGIKQKKVVTENGNTNTTEYAGNFIYEDGALKMFFQPEGYVEPNDPNDYTQGFQYVYQYRDQPWAM